VTIDNYTLNSNLLPLIIFIFTCVWNYFETSCTFHIFIDIYFIFCSSTALQSLQIIQLLNIAKRIALKQWKTVRTIIYTKTSPMLLKKWNTLNLQSKFQPQLSVYVREQKQTTLTWKCNRRQKDRTKFQPIQNRIQWPTPRVDELQNDCINSRDSQPDLNIGSMLMMEDIHRLILL
jgi:hypothetical protein